MKTCRIEKEIKVELESEKTITTEVKFIGSYDPKYGADADGNRGIGAWLCDDVEFDLKETDDSGNKLTEEEKKEYKEILNERIEDIEIDFEREAEEQESYDHD